MANAPVSITALLHGPDKTGIVAGVSAWIYEGGGNILHADQHHDPEQSVFFQRVEWVLPNVQDQEKLRAHAKSFAVFAEGFGMTVRTALSTDRQKVVVMVSRHGHAYHDLMLRWQVGELPCDIVAVISNHKVLGASAESYGAPFHYLPVTKETKHDVEAAQLAILAETKADLVVMARYMQVLSDGFLGKFGKPVINIHHSFLPAFAGARPYHQAHERGVKLIGATAHYATADLDEGPIINQAVERVSHRHTVPEMVRKGRDLEKLALSQAVRWQLENRILVYHNKTVVFD